jgi:hypothetical protein
MTVFVEMDEEDDMSEQALRKVLLADVIGSGASVVFTIAGAGAIAGWLDVSVWIPLVVGLVLIPWVWLLVRTVRRDRLRVGEVAAIVIGNIVWAVIAVVLIFGFPDALSSGGRWIVGLFSLAVLGYGVLELMGLSRLASSRDLRPPSMAA